MLVTSSLLSQLPGVVHGFTTRHGGCSHGPLSSLNLAWDRGLADDNEENWRRVKKHVGWSSSPVAVVHQVHGIGVWKAQPNGTPLCPQADSDAVWTDRTHELVAVRTADCVPILIAGPSVVLAVHAGWRGTAQGIVSHAVAEICRQLHCEPAELVAAIGPCISVDRYEVGEDVVAGIAQRVDESVFVRRTTPRPHVDLKAANAQLLRDAGVQHIDVLPHCTHTDSDFFSHRRDGVQTGRMASFIGRVST